MNQLFECVPLTSDVRHIEQIRAFVIDREKEVSCREKVHISCLADDAASAFVHPQFHLADPLHFDYIKSVLLRRFDDALINGPIIEGNDIISGVFNVGAVPR